MSKAAKLVGSGCFKVDRQRALEKLKEFQLPDPDMFLLPWIRCAVASGATRLTLDLDSSKISFNGQGFTREELADPYGCLFDEAASAPPRNRQLAYALLATLRRVNYRFSVTSGRPRRPERCTLTVNSLAEETFSYGLEPGTDTVVNLKSEGVWFRNPNPLGYTEGEGDISLSPSVGYALDLHIPEIISIEVLPESVAQFVRERSKKPQPDADHSLEFRNGPLTVLLHVPGRLNPDGSCFRLAHFGVFVETVEGRSIAPIVPVEGTINDNEFALNVSQSGVVRNERFDAVIHETALQAEELLSKVCRAQAARMKDTGQLLKSLLVQRGWALWLRQGEEAEAGGFWMDLSFFEVMAYVWKLITSPALPDPEWEAKENRRLIWSTAQGTHWLRRICGLACKEQLTVAEKTLTDLKAAPIFWDLNETLLSTADLEKTLCRLGYLPVSSQKADVNPPPYPVVWAWCAEERAALDWIFPGQAVADVTETVTVATDGTARGEASQSGLLEQVGRFDLLIRGRFDTDRAWGEVSLPMLRIARLLCFYKREPAGIIEVKCGLPFLAAVDITNLVKNPKATDHLADQVPAQDQRALETAAVAAARNLYRKLAEEVSDTNSCWQLKQTDWAILQHLQNFLFWVRTSGQASEDDRWIDSYPLFFTNTGTRWSFLKLRDFLDTGQALLLHGALTAVEVGKVSLRGVALREVAPEFLFRLFPDAMFERVPDLRGVTEMTKRSPASAGLPLSEKEIVQAPTQQETGPPQAETAQTPAPQEKVVMPAPTPVAAQTRETESSQAEAAPPHELPVETAPREASRRQRIVAPDSSSTESGGDPRVLQLAHHILTHLQGRRGMKLLGQSVPTLRLQHLLDGGLLDIRGEERWDLNDAHPLTKAMLDSSLPDSEKSAYLASLVYTAANRDLASVTDQDDVEFQHALVDHLTEGSNNDP